MKNPIIQEKTKENREYEVVGLDAAGKEVSIHLREEITTGKDRIVFFVSCY